MSCAAGKQHHSLPYLPTVTVTIIIILNVVVFVLVGLAFFWYIKIVFGRK